METTHNLLDLICLFCDRDPVQEDGPQTEDMVSHCWFSPLCDNIGQQMEDPYYTTTKCHQIKKNICLRRTALSENVNENNQIDPG